MDITAFHVLKALDAKADIDKESEDVAARKRDRDSAAAKMRDTKVIFYTVVYNGCVPTEGVFSVVQPRRIAYYGKKADRDAAFDRYLMHMCRFKKPEYLELIEKQEIHDYTLDMIGERDFRARMDMALQNKFVDDFMVMAFRCAPPSTPCLYMLVNTPQCMRDINGLWEDEVDRAKLAITSILKRIGVFPEITVRRMNPADVPCHDLQTYICHSRDLKFEADCIATSIKNADF